MGLFDGILGGDPEKERRSFYNGYDPEKKSVAVIGSNGNGHGTLVWWAGGHLALEINEYGFSDLGDLGLDDCPIGIWVWEGKYIYHSGVNCEGIDVGGDAEPKGEFRKPTDEEWAAIREGRSPWNDDDWKIEPEGDEG